MPLQPTPEQQQWIDKFVNTDASGGIMGLGTGVGKSLCATEAARLRDAKRVLIMAPQSTFDSWASTVYWQTGRRLKRCANNAFTFAFTPDPTDRDRTETVKLSAALCKRNMESCMAGDDGWFFVTRELFTLKDWKRTPVMRDGKEVIDPKTKKPKMKRQKLGAWQKKRDFDMIILDENQKFAKLGNYGQQSFRSMRGFKTVLSADWFGSDLIEMHTVAVDVFGAEAVRVNRSEFKDSYLLTEYDHFAYDKKRVIGEQIPGLFVSDLPLYVTSPPSVQPPEPEIRYVTLSKAERDLYDRLEANYVAMVGDDVLNIGIPLELRIRLRELSLGMFRVERTGMVRESDGIEKTTIQFDPGAHSSKIDEIKSILAEHPGKKFVIFSHSSKWCEKAAIDLGGAAWVGSRTAKERAQIKDDFIRGDLRLFTATVETMGTGTDGLQAVCHNVIVASPSDQAIANTQGVSRVARQGQKHPVNLWHLVARDTFDAGVLRGLSQKVTLNNSAKGWM